MKSPGTNSCPETAAPDYGRGTFFFDREPVTVRAWIVSWHWRFGNHALRLDWDTAADMAAALHQCSLMDDPEIFQVALWPCAKDFAGYTLEPGLYRKAAQTMRRFAAKPDLEIELRWIVDQAGYRLPDRFELLEIRERSRGR